MPTPPKILNAEVVERIVTAVRHGCTYSAAASAGPIAESTFFGWMRQAELDSIDGGGDTEYTEFAERIAEANATAERLVTMAWMAHCRTDWRACRDFLARRHPDKWGPRASADANHSWASDHEMALSLGDAMEAWLRENDAEANPFTE